MRRPTALIPAVMIMGALGGCVLNSNMPPKPVGPVDAIELRASASAIDWDGQPGADGLQVQVGFYRNTPNGYAEMVTVSGTLELQMFEGRVPNGKIRQSHPLHTWSFSGQQLPPHAARNIVGWGYVLRLPFPEAATPAGQITLVARYLAPGTQKWFYSAANSSIVIAGQ